MCTTDIQDQCSACVCVCVCKSHAWLELMCVFRWVSIFLVTETSNSYKISLRIFCVMFWTVSLVFAPVWVVGEPPLPKMRWNANSVIIHSFKKWSDHAKYLPSKINVHRCFPAAEVRITFIFSCVLHLYLTGEPRLLPDFSTKGEWRQRYDSALNWSFVRVWDRQVGCLLMTKLKGSGKRPSWPVLNYYPSLFSDAVEMTKLLGIVSLRAVMKTRDLRKMKQKW